LAIDSIVESQIEKHTSKLIKDLLDSHEHDEASVTIDLKDNIDSHSNQITDNIMIYLRSYAARDLRATDMSTLRAAIYDAVKLVLKKRIDYHEKMTKFENRVDRIEGFVDRRFHTLSREERLVLKKKYTDQAKEEFIKRGSLTQELYDKVLEKRGEEEKKKDAEMAEEQEFLKLAKDSIKARGKVSRTTKGLFDASKDSEVIVGSELGERDRFFRRKLSKKGRKKSRERYYAFMEWYNQEMANLRAAYEKGDIEKDEFQRRENELNSYLKKQTGVGGIRRVGKKFRSIESHHYSTQLKNVVYLLAAVLIGAIITGTTGSWLFFVGFLGVALYLIAPDPRNIKPKKGQKIGLSSVLLFHPETRSKQNTAAFFRSLGKVTAIAFFAFGFQGLGDVFNTLYIATAIIGYFLLKVEYENSPEFIESLLRFFLGIILIPWIFNDIFDSLVLAGIAFAFFAVPPLPNESNKNIGQVLSRGLSGATAYYEMAEKFIFGIVMILVLIGSGSLDFAGISPAAGWGLTGTLQYTFIYFWIVCGVAGFFSPAKERPVTGAIMLGAALVIYGIGPGSQAVGSGLLGQWWPSIHNTFTSITEPMADIMGSLGNTFGQGFMLLTNPVGYATQLMNGTYAQNPLGQTGSFGVDINEFTITNIFPEQPFVVTAIMENKGAFKAENVSISLMAAGGDKFATEGTSRTRSLQWTYNPYDVYGRKTMFMDIDKLGFKKGMACNYLTDDKKECFQLYGVDISDAQAKGGKELDRLMVWQATFQSSRIECIDIVELSLRKRFIPITARIKYDYQSDSRVEVEFISTAEWGRLAQAGQLDQGFAFVESQYSSAPVKFPIGTAGLKNPILENQQFHISMMLDSAFESGGQIDKVESVQLRYSTDWEIKGECTPKGVVEKSKGTVTWKPGTGGGQTFYCYFEPLNKNAMGGAPSKTYVVTAHANYTFSRWKYKDTQIQFGGFCCPDTTGCTENCKSEDCLDGQYCLNNACVYGVGGNGVNPQTKPGDADFCQKKISGELVGIGYDQGGCDIGMGGCQSGECSTRIEIDIDEDGYTGVNKCESVSGLSIKICCPRKNTQGGEELTENECKRLYDLWISKGSPLTIDEIYNVR